MQPSVEIIIVNWNGLEDTLACLESLKAVTYPNFTVTVVDNGSTDGQAEVLKGHGATVVSSEKNLGFTGGNNLAWKKSSADYVLLLNNDTLVPPGFLEPLVTAAEQNGVGIAGPLILNLDGSHQSAGARLNLWTGSTPLLPLRGQEPYAVDIVSGCAILIKKAVWEKIGFFDDDYFTYYEESDYCLRAKRAGFSTVVVPGSTITHKGGGSSSSSYQERMLMKNRLVFLRKNASRAQRTTALLYLCLFYLWARSLRIRNVAQLSALWKGFREGVRPS